MPTYTSSPTTGTSLAALSASDVRTLYSQTVMAHEQMHDFWHEFEGRSPQSIIQSKRDLSKGAGQDIRFTNIAGFYMEAKQGDQIFEDGDDFERLKISGFNLTVDFLRHGVRITARAEEYMGLRGELRGQIPANLGAWLGREKTFRMEQMFIRKGDTRNTAYAGGKATRDELTTTDTLTYAEATRLKRLMSRVGGRPGAVAKKGKNVIKKFCIVGTSDGLYSLENSSEYKTMLESADARGGMNYLFSGGFTDLRGMIIKEYDVIDHDGDGPIGSSLAPRAELGAAIVAGTGALELKGGGTAGAAALPNVAYWRCFPNFPVVFTPDDTEAAGTDAWYLTVYNHEDSAAGSDMGKFCIYKCTSNDWDGGLLNTVTVTERLGATTSGVAQKAQVGNVVWDAAVNTQDHPIGAVAVLSNANGVPIGRSICLAKRAAFRGYGKFERMASKQSHEGEGEKAFIYDRFITSVFGQAPCQDTKARKPGFIVLEHAIVYAGEEITPTLA